MHNEFVVKESSYEPPELVGAWSGEWSEIYTPKGEFVMMSLDVFFPVPFRAGPIWIRTFHYLTRDECIEAFGKWVDSMLETDSIR